MSYYDGEDFSAMHSALKLRFVRFACLFVFVATLFTSRLLGQSAAEAAKIAAPLPADARAVLDRLSMPATWPMARPSASTRAAGSPSR
jgi:hypothetical protein